MELWIPVLMSIYEDCTVYSCYEVMPGSGLKNELYFTNLVCFCIASIFDAPLVFALSQMPPSKCSAVAIDFSLYLCLDLSLVMQFPPLNPKLLEGSLHSASQMQSQSRFPPRFEGGFMLHKPTNFLLLHITK